MLAKQKLCTRCNCVSLAVDLDGCLVRVPVIAAVVAALGIAVLVDKAQVHVMEALGGVGWGCGVGSTSVNGPTAAQTPL